MNQSIPVLFTRPCKERERRDDPSATLRPTGTWIQSLGPNKLVNEMDMFKNNDQKQGFSASALLTFDWIILSDGAVCALWAVWQHLVSISQILIIHSPPHPNCDNQKCLQALTSVPWGAKLPPTHILGIGSATSMRMPEFSKQKGAESYIVYIMGLEAGTMSFSSCQKDISQDFPEGSVVKNPPANAGDEGSIPGGGTKIPYALEQPSPHAPQLKKSIHCHKDTAQSK